jgi:hypothetical protein
LISATAHIAPTAAGEKWEAFLLLYVEIEPLPSFITGKVIAAHEPARAQGSISGESLVYGGG